MPQPVLTAAFATVAALAAVTNTCGLARILARLPCNRPDATRPDATLAALKG
ncbi:hypothetical protein ACIQXA_36645 [Streptomyces massasporeus]|uniref:hypothetical protein n=1 Tax=Streptomyces massasporeus TaxID=67324 RepID=UPI00380A94AC